ncbi:hypothetical protein G8770_01420 [Aestuariicella hydrocarbonica]|uniref:Uncharacterized protein n=1 Tax=Pseudomaricurvus hydrocarbonicus TaxID=1470433 RepID=A0A9E5JPI4_9GAMM|nr:hypothetical protein [Aestuariicella hydrocarbonica]NHO64203.1 hypothetical protein [Aestuariicella hydrocarbonica]
MSEMLSTYRVVFWGDVAAGHSKRDVALKFARQFGLKNSRQLKHLFSGRFLTLKRGLSEAEAQRYRRVIDGLGGVCRVEREVTSFSCANRSQKPQKRLPGPLEKPETMFSMLDLKTVEEAPEPEADERRNPFAARDLTTR